LLRNLLLTHLNPKILTQIISEKECINKKYYCFFLYFFIFNNLSKKIRIWKKNSAFQIQNIVMLILQDLRMKIKEKIYFEFINLIKKIQKQKIPNRNFYNFMYTLKINFLLKKKFDVKSSWRCRFRLIWNIIRLISSIVNA